MKTKDEIIRENIKNKARPEAVLKAEFSPHLNDGINRMRPGEKWTTTQLCGSVYWESLELVDRIESGKIIRDMVRKGELPLECVNKRGDNSPRKYVHISNPIPHSTKEEA